MRFAFILLVLLTVGGCSSQQAFDASKLRMSVDGTQTYKEAKVGVAQSANRGLRGPCRISVTQGIGSHTATYCRRYPRWEASAFMWRVAPLVPSSAADSRRKAPGRE